MRLCMRHASGLFLAASLAAGCGGGQSGDLPRAPAPTGDSKPSSEEKKVGDVKTIAPADAAEKYK